MQVCYITNYHTHVHMAYCWLYSDTESEDDLDLSITSNDETEASLPNEDPEFEIQSAPQYSTLHRFVKMKHANYVPYMPLL